MSTETGQAQAQAQSTNELIMWFSSRSSALAQTIAVIEGRAASQRADIQRQLRSLAVKLAKTEREIERAEHTQAPLPEAEELSWLPGAPNLDIERSIEEEDLEDNDPQPILPVRNRLLPEELARIQGKSVQTIRRWMDPDRLEKTKRTESVLWTAEDLRSGRVVINTGGRQRFINADDLDWNGLTSGQQQQLRVLLTQPLRDGTA